MQFKIRIFIIFLGVASLASPQLSNAQTDKFKITPVFGVVYTKETQLGAIAGFNGEYENGHINVGTLITTNLSASGHITGIHYSCSDKFITKYYAGYNRTPLYFWGIGYENNINNSNRSTFLENGVNVRLDLLHQQTKTINYGVSLGYNYFDGSKFSDPSLIEAHISRSSAANIGALFDYDNRNSSYSPTKGIHISFEQFLYKETTPNTKPYYKTTIITDLFLPLWKNGVLAFDIFGESNYGNTNWTSWSDFGGENRMRGYYRGRYRDRNIISAQMELRILFEKDKPFDWGHGPVAWVGAGNIFNNIQSFDIKNSLPTYGLGYRVLIATSMFRFDFGFGTKGNFGVYAGINQAF